MPILGIYASQNYVRGLLVDYLVVAGGGGAQVGGGGAGGYRTSIGGTSLSLASNTAFTVTIGAGGTGAVFNGSSTKGGNSTFSTITSTGGGQSGKTDTTPKNGFAGGSGGGGAGDGGATTTGGAGNEGSYSPVEGYAGGGNGGNVASPYPGGGGGGSAAIGSNASASLGGAGGAGTSNSISGTATTYAVGGDGGLGAASSGNGANGTTNRGNGGFGSRQTTTGIGGAGGSGIVIARYSGTTQKAYGGTVTTSGGNTIHTFTSSGNFYTGTEPAVTGYALWLDASDASTFTYSSGTRVSQWNDKSGNARHMTQATTAYQPDRNATQNGLSAVTMRSGSAEYWMRNTSYDWAHSAFTVLCVVQPRTGDYTAYLSQDIVASLQVGQDASNPAGLAISKVSQATTACNLTLANNTTGQITYKSAGISSGNVSVQIYKSKTAASGTVSLTGLVDSTIAMIGGSRSDVAPAIGDNYGDGGFLCELLVYPSQLSDSDRVAVENYLIAKWGVS